MKQPKRASREIIQAIMDKAEVKRARAYQMIEEVKRSRAIDVRTAASYVAAQLGIDVQKRSFGLTDVDKQKLSGFLTTAQAAASVGLQDRKVKGTTQPTVFQIGSKLAETLLLTPGMIKQAAEMAEVYPFVYILENSFRELILITLEKKHGKDWWSKATISSDVRKKVDSRVDQEDENRWHTKRGAHQILYTDFSDIGGIIINNWPEFKDVFKKQYRLQAKLEEIELSRNIIAHNNPLPDKEIRRLRLNFDDWTRILKATV